MIPAVSPPKAPHAGGADIWSYCRFVREDHKLVSSSKSTKYFNLTLHFLPLNARRFRKLRKNSVSIWRI
jgi:hypothetical protein